MHCLSWKEIKSIACTTFLLVSEIYVTIGAPSPLGASQAAVSNPNISSFRSGSLRLSVGQSVRSNNGQYTLLMQADGNLVLYHINKAFFSTLTQGTGSTYSIFQSDGNLVVYNSVGQPKWNSHTAGNPGSTLVVQDDGNLVIYNSARIAIWNSQSNFGSNVFVNHLVTGTNANTRIVSPVYPTEDVVVADYDAVLDFHADRTGVVEAGGIIQSALDQCERDGGGTVWLPVGKYLVSSAIKIHPYCYLRGDWCDPDRIQGQSAAGSYGTLILANVPQSNPFQGSGGNSVFTLETNSGLMGVTIFYPTQSLNGVISFGYSIIVQDGSAMSLIQDVTLLNSYAGVIISPNPSATNAHEFARVRNLKGTALMRGMTSNNSSDADVYENIVFSGKYWSEANTLCVPPSLSEISNYTLLAGIAFAFQDLEQSQIDLISANSYQVGIQVNPYVRQPMCAFFIDANISNCFEALLCLPSSLDARWGLSFTGGTLSGSYSVLNESNYSWIMGNQASFNGAVLGTIADGSTFPRSDSGAPIPSYPSVEPSLVPRTSGQVLLNTANSPYNVVRMAYNSDGSIPSPDLDATPGIQQALNDASALGGGVVYLPAGWYAIATHLLVPSNVELRGAASGPSRDSSSGYSGGTILFGYEGGGSPTQGSDPALITLNGANSGVCGLRIFYPAENLWSSRTIGFPTSIRGNGANVYVRNVAVLNGTIDLDLYTHPCDHHYVDNLYGWAASTMVYVGNGSGMLRTIASNGDFANRNAFGIQGWIMGGAGPNIEKLSFNNASQGHATLIIVEQPIGVISTGSEVITNAFSYGDLFGVYNKSPNTVVFNLSTDGLGLQAGGSSGYNIVATQPITVVSTSMLSGIGPTYGYAPNGNIVYYSYSRAGETGRSKATDW